MCCRSMGSNLENLEMSSIMTKGSKKIDIVWYLIIIDNLYVGREITFPQSVVLKVVSYNIIIHEIFNNVKKI
jgi:hypothetical protein